MANGFFMLPEPKVEPYQHLNANFTLFPVKMPSTLFDDFVNYNTSINSFLLEVLIKDPEWVIEISSKVDDPFVKNLVVIAQKYLAKPL